MRWGVPADDIKAIQIMRYLSLKQSVVRREAMEKNKCSIKVLIAHTIDHWTMGCIKYLFLYYFKYTFLHCSIILK